MALSLSVAVRNAMLDAIETTVGTSPILKLRTGAAPGIGNADAGTILVEMTCPSNWMDAAAAGAKVKAGTWEGTAITNGDAEHFRMYAPIGPTQHIEGTVTASGGGGNLILLVNGVPGNSIVVGDLCSVEVFTLDV